MEGASPPPKTSRPAVRAVLLVLAGPAGSGKTTLCEHLVATEPGCARVVTATTRPPRPGEINGVHYHFLTPAEFDVKVAAGEFLEWALVHGTGGDRRYGTPASSVLGPLAAGTSLVINIDVQGVDAFRRAAREWPALGQAMGTAFISVAPAELRARLVARGDNEAEIERRMVTAARELAEAPKFDFRIESRSREEDFQAVRDIWNRLRNSERNWPQKVAEGAKK
jgi:guanylate kinase